ncbi:MAG: alpha/beta hydrolase [Deltaproteobacteria bacterium]|nr:alpha/beta hydrolase [Deltaproteobacteria bacterium]
MRWLLLRGLTRERRHWLDFPAFFVDHVRGPDAGPTDVITLDLPGFGTQRELPVPPTVEGFVEDIRARLQPLVRPGEPLGLVAVSLGGIVALTWLARYPQDFVCGAVINASMGDLSPLWQRMRPHNWPKIVAALVMGVHARERMLLGMTRHQGNLDQDALRHVEFAATAPPAKRAFLGQLTAAIKVKAPSSITVPTFVLTSHGDELVSWRCSEAIAQLLSLPLKVHEGQGTQAAGHDLALDDPQWVCNRLNELVATLAVSSSATAGAVDDAAAAKTAHAQNPAP